MSRDQRSSSNMSHSDPRNQFQSRPESTTPAENDQIVHQYQQIIREQDARLKAQLEENQSLRMTCDQLQANCKHTTALMNEKSAQTEVLLNEKLGMRAKISMLETKVDQLESKCSGQSDELSRLKRDKGAWKESFSALKTTDPNSGSAAENMELKVAIKQMGVEQENLLTLMADMEEKLARYKKLLRLCGQDGELSESDDNEDDNEVDGAKNQMDGFPSNQNKASSNTICAWGVCFVKFYASELVKCEVEIFYSSEILKTYWKKSEIA